jgi:hypothetical protein
LNSMESKKYRKFLEKQAEKNPVNIEDSKTTMGFKITWDKTHDETVRSGSSDILDSLYLGKNMEENVTVERKAASLIKDRLRGLEEENLRLRRHITSFKVLLVALGISFIFVVAILISILLPQYRIIL